MAEEKELVASSDYDRLPRIDQPNTLDITLFPHQLVSVYKMERMERVQKVKASDSQVFMTKFGVLGDIPGYGKSFSIVALILRDQMPHDVNESHCVYEYFGVNSAVTQVTSRHLRRVRANLLVASSTLVEQWKEYFSFVKDPAFRLKEVSSLKDVNGVNPNDWDVILVSANRFNALIDAHPGVAWKRFIFDEAANTHINGMRHITAGFTWFITATYNNLFNSSGNTYHYLKQWMHSFSRDMLRHFVVKNPIEFVQSSFRMPAVHEARHLCQNPRVLNVLSRYLDDETKLMISAGDIRGAISRVGGASTHANNLFEIVANRQREKLASAKFSLGMWQARENSEKEVEFWQKRVASLEQTLGELEEKYKNVLSDDCTICYSTISEPVLVPCCQSVFCGGCLMRWLESKKSCPMCRASIELKDFVYIHSSAISLTEDDGKEQKVDPAPVQRPLQKQEMVRLLVADGVGKGKKFLIFSSYDESFFTIRRELEMHNLPFVEMCGAKATRDAKLKRFREGKVNVVFLNSRFNGAGINLEMATDIILYHEMAQALKDQVVGRALRIGRREDLTIHHLVFQ